MKKRRNEGLERMRRRLPIVDALPPSKNRRVLPRAQGAAPKPTLAVWALTQACDQACRACGPRSGHKLPDELTTEEALRLVGELAELGVGEVVLIGGEAYLRHDFLLVIRAIREHGMKATMTTGGYGFTKQHVEAAVQAGLQLVSCSIDGMEETHDSLRRRPGSWRRAFAALDNVRRAGAQPAANTQINRRTMGELLELCDRLADYGVVAWQMFFTIPHGGAADHPDLVLQPYMLLEVFELLERVVERCREHGIVVYPGNNLGYFGPLETALRRAQSDHQHYQGCQAGVSGLGIEADGTIKSCPSLGAELNGGGNWRDHGLAAIWERAPQMRYIERRTVDALWGYCRECYYASVCKAGCTATSEPMLGRPGNNPFCHHRALERDREGLRERLEPIAAAPGRPFDHGLFKLIVEPKEGGDPVEVVMPRTSRNVHPDGIGEEVDLGAASESIA